MQEIFTIFWEVLSPIFIVIIAGFLMQKKFNFDLNGFTKIQLYLFIPALIFIKIATSDLEGDLVIQVIFFTLFLFIILILLSFIAARVLHLDHKKEKAFINAVSLRNQGNFAIPLISLLYATTATGNTYALSIHMISLFMSNILLNTIGLYNASSGTYSRKEAIKKILQLPMVYVVMLGFVFNGFALQIPSPVASSINIMGEGVVPLALFTLGAKLASAKLAFVDKSLPIAVIMRLILSPLLAYGLTLIFGFTGTVAEVLIIGAAAPTAVNSVLLAIEFKGDAEYASETVFLTTLLSAITVALTIQIVM